MSEAILVQGRKAQIRSHYGKWYIADGNGFEFYRDGVWRDDWSSTDYWPTESAARKFAEEHATP